MSQLRRRRAFTLVELMIVVGIIGLLAAIAIPNYMRFQLKSKSAEGKTNLAAIRSAEESHYAEFNVYVSADVAPAATPGSRKTGFVPSAGFTSLSWAPEGDVFFSYGVSTAGGGQTYHASAQANLDDDATSQLWHYRSGDLASKDHPGPPPTACGAGSGRIEQIEPCDASSGHSVF